MAELTTDQTITSQLGEAGELFRSTVAFPTPQFPGVKSQNILDALLRSKFEPNIEDWVKEGEDIAARQRKTTSRGLSESERNELWQWAPGAANSAARRQTWGGDYTRAEMQGGIENVVTGLRRQLVEPPEGEDEEDAEDDEDEYEVTDEEGEEGGAMDIEKQQPKPESKSIPETQTAPPTPGLMPLASIHKFMTTGR
ncbi:Mediator of RNA polymerase II transcription subunit 8 [Cladophialophora carrionii]|uniref:Mediator of RNA polymerase II transcription subunit 8 n=1 Tax=Cladophialophora carrionii TaxID=86049 RepID=A0A1C1CEC9_9EURO|nr:Mediator of RNA polymerase II transcription subunit 8 [Cladophialophora carrionii]